LALPSLFCFILLDMSLTFPSSSRETLFPSMPPRFFRPWSTVVVVENDDDDEDDDDDDDGEDDDDDEAATN